MQAGIAGSELILSKSQITASVLNQAPLGHYTRKYELKHDGFIV